MVMQCWQQINNHIPVNQPLLYPLYGFKDKLYVKQQRILMDYYEFKCHTHPHANSATMYAHIGKNDGFKS